MTFHTHSDNGLCSSQKFIPFITKLLDERHVYSTYNIQRDFHDNRRKSMIMHVVTGETSQRGVCI